MAPPNPLELLKQALATAATGDAVATKADFEKALKAAEFGDGGPDDPPAGVGQLDDGKFTVNVDQASLPESAKLILGETLGFNYTVDPRVQGTVTLVSNR